MPYNDANRAFLQAFLAKRVFTFPEARPILAAILTAQRNDDTEVPPETITEQTFNQYISDTNDAISKFDLEIRSMLNQNDRSRIYALVNTTSDELTQLATTHTADEISFFKRLMDAMFLTNNTPTHEILAIQSIPALRLHKNPDSQRRAPNNDQPTQSTSSTTGLSMAAAEAALTAFIEEGWLEKSQMGYLTLAPRALLELKVYLTQTYNSPDEEDPEGSGTAPDIERIKSCHGCKEIITIGQRCPNLECGVRFHDPCAVIQFSGGRSSVGPASGAKCPGCGEEWTGREYVGERADNGRRRRTATGSSGKRSSGAVSSIVGNSGGRLTRTAVNGVAGASGTQRSSRSRRHATVEQEEDPDELVPKEEEEGFDE